MDRVDNVTIVPLTIVSDCNETSVFASVSNEMNLFEVV